MLFTRAEDATYTGGIVNGRCYRETAALDAPPLYQNGSITFQAHHVGWIVSGLFAMAATIASFWLVGKHLQWYTNKHEQRYIVRILFMVPIYAWVSFASYLYWNHSTVLILLRDGYESTVLTAFFYLLLLYLDPDPEGQKDIMRKEGLSRENDEEARRLRRPLKKWAFPLGSVRSKPADGLYFLQLMKWGVLQYCVLRPLTTLAAVVLDYLGLYCEQTYSPRWGAVWILIIVSLSVTIAMYCLIQFYVCVADHLKPKQPLLKLFAVKAVVFLTFWQMFCLGLLASFGIVKDTKYMTAEDINIGFGALLQTFEMTCFAFLHIKAFSYKPYVLLPDSPAVAYIPRYSRLRALGHAFDFRETLRELWDGCIYMGQQMRGKETDVRARRVAVMERALGRSRGLAGEKHPFVGQDEDWDPADDYPLPAPAGDNRLKVQVGVDRHRDVSGQRQWLGVSDHGARREKSDGLEAEIERELQTRGYTLRGPSIQREQKRDRRSTTAHGRDKSSWWRRAFNRFSHSSSADIGAEHATHLSPAPVPRRERRNPHESWTRSRRLREPRVERDVDGLVEYGDPPPPSVIRTFRERDRRRDDGNDQEHRVGHTRMDGYAGFPVAEEDDGLLSLDDYNRRTRGETLSFSPTSPGARQHQPAPRGWDQEQMYPHIIQPVPIRHSAHVLQQPMSGRVIRSDSLLGRVFPHTEGEHSTRTETAPSTDPSVQSHRTNVKMADAARRPQQVRVENAAAGSRGIIQVGRANPNLPASPLAATPFESTLAGSITTNSPLILGTHADVASTTDDTHTTPVYPLIHHSLPRPARYDSDVRRQSAGHLALLDPPVRYAPSSSRLDIEPTANARYHNTSLSTETRTPTSSRSARPPAPPPAVYSPHNEPLRSASEALPPVPAPMSLSMPSPPAARRAPARIVMPSPLAPRAAAYSPPSPARRGGSGAQSEARRDVEGRERPGPAGYAMYPDEVGVHSLQPPRGGERVESRGSRNGHSPRASNARTRRS